LAALLAFLVDFLAFLAAGFLLAFFEAVFFEADFLVGLLGMAFLLALDTLAPIMFTIYYLTTKKTEYKLI